MDNQFQENRTFWTGHFGDRGHFGVRTFIEIRRNVLFFLKGDISAKGDISVSNSMLNLAAPIFRFIYNYLILLVTTVTDF